MSRTKLLLGIVQDLNELAADIQALADAVETGDEVQPPKLEPVVPKAKQITIEQIRAVLCKKEILAAQALLQKYGVRRLSDLGKESYDPFLEEAEALTDKEFADAPG